MRVWLLLVLAASLAACDSLAGGDEVPVDFGDDYEVLRTPFDPAVEEDRLRVSVRYGGGCAEHTFTPRSSVEGGAARVWLVHDGNGDACYALLSTTLDLALPRRAADARRLVLLTPGGEEVRLR